MTVEKLAQGGLIRALFDCYYNKRDKKGMNEQSRQDVEWMASNHSAMELLEMGDPDAIVEFVGDWVEDNCDYSTEEEWSDLCFVAYEFWGCAGIPSHSPQWDEFWFNKAKEEDS